MSLLHTKHDDRKSAALSITANRVSKIDKLRLDDDERCHLSAVRCADSLLRDVCEYIANGETLNDPRHAQELANMATCARDQLDTKETSK